MNNAAPNFFYVNRELLHSDRWLAEPFTRGQAWVDLFGLAQHTKGFFRVRGIRVDVERGQLAYSQLSLAKRWRWSRDKVRRYLSELEKYEDIIQQKNEVTTLITILKYDKWQGDNTTTDTTIKQQKNNRKTSNDTHTKNDNNVNNDNKENNITILQPKAAESVNKIFNIFYKINPTINFGNKTQRSATEEMVKQLGEEKVLKMAEYAVNIFGQQYAPTITNPLELKNNMAKLAAYWKKQENSNQPNVVSI